jgi:hypothetical protein
MEKLEGHGTAPSVEWEISGQQAADYRRPATRPAGRHAAHAGARSVGCMLGLAGAVRHAIIRAGIGSIQG